MEKYYIELGTIIIIIMLYFLGTLLKISILKAANKKVEEDTIISVDNLKNDKNLINWPITAWTLLYVLILNLALGVYYWGILHR